MALLSEQDRQALETQFRALTQDVNLLFFSQQTGCPTCGLANEVLKEVVALSPRIKLKEYNLALDRGQAALSGVDKAPAIVITGADEKPSGIKFYGLPAGYEFMSLLGAIFDRGAGIIELAPETQQAVKALAQDVHIQVFVTPSCPYCPMAVRLAHQMALLNPKITAEMVEAEEFPELARRYQVLGVPRVVINERHFFEGAVPEQVFLGHVHEALAAAEKPRIILTGRN